MWLTKPRRPRAKPAAGCWKLHWLAYFAFCILWRGWLLRLEKSQQCGFSYIVGQPGFHEMRYREARQSVGGTAMDSAERARGEGGRGVGRAAPCPADTAPLRPCGRGRRVTELFQRPRLEQTFVPKLWLSIARPDRGPLKRAWFGTGNCSNACPQFVPNTWFGTDFCSKWYGPRRLSIARPQRPLPKPAQHWNIFLFQRVFQT